MGFVNMMAIDRSNRESAIRTDRSRGATHSLGHLVWSFCRRYSGAKPGDLLPFKKGAFTWREQAGVPVVPIAIKNSDELMGKGTGEAQSGMIEMVMMPPVDDRSFETDEDINRLIDQRA